MKLVMVESPFRGNGWAKLSKEEQDAVYARNKAYAVRCVHDSLTRGEAGFAMHLHFPLALDDTKPEERELGIAAGLAWSAAAELVAVYTDLGITEGMERAIKRAEWNAIRVELRTLAGARRAEPTSDVVPILEKAMREASLRGALVTVGRRAPGDVSWEAVQETFPSWSVEEIEKACHALCLHLKIKQPEGRELVSLENMDDKIEVRGLSVRLDRLTTDDHLAVVGPGQLKKGELAGSYRLVTYFAFCDPADVAARLGKP